VATGSVASVKVPELVKKLSEFADVAVILTAPAEVMTSKRVAGRYSPECYEAFQALQVKGVHVLRDEDEWDRYEDVSSDSVVVHIELRRWADIAVVAPCSANTLAKLALGLCDNLATSFLRAWDPDKPLLVAPAMNTLMWEHPSTAEHLTTLQARGCSIIPPVSKKLACGDVGRGALAAVSDIIEAVVKASVGAAERRASSGIGSWRAHGFEEWRPAKAA
ncbi:HAL3B, partial [Symbiodinium pilosum]